MNRPENSKFEKNNSKISMKNGKNDEKATEKGGGKEGVNGKREGEVKAPASLPTSNSRTRTLLISLTLALSILVYRHYPSPSSLFSCTSSSLSRATLNTSDLPTTYALCSHPADGKKVYTVDVDNSAVECVVVRGERVVDVGDLDAVRDRFDVDGKGVQCELSVRHIPKGAIVVPGLSDSHCHILEYGASSQIPLAEGKSAAETVTLVREYIEADPDILQDKERTVEGWGWDHASWDEAKMPTWHDLEADAVTSNRRIILQSRDGHAIWVSRRTLEENQPLPDTVDGGVIIRDDNGEPTGIFVDSAQDLINRLPLTDADLLRRFQTTVDAALSHGLTSLHDAGFKPESLAFFQRQSEKGPLPIRIYGMSYFDEYGPYWGDQLVPFSADLNKEGESERLSRRSVKIFADGALRTGGAALYEPYADNPSTNGVMRISAEVLERVVPKFLKDGWQVNVHAIGDRANSIVLDAFENALRGVGVNVSALRPRLEHAQIMTRADMKRLGDLGVIASIQATHVISDMWFAQDRLGPERVKGLYAFRHLIDSGARITLGSDFPVEDVNPLKGFYAAITRLAVDGTSPHGPGGWFPDQRLTRIEALRGMTIDPAYASFSEKALGSLEPKKRADWVVLSGDIMELDAKELVNVKVLATALDGRVVYGGI